LTTVTCYKCDGKGKLWEILKKLFVFLSCFYLWFQMLRSIKKHL
jgi:hypothetical protein